MDIPKSRAFYPLVFVLLVASFFLLDKRIALVFRELFAAEREWNLSASNIPDVLMPLVGIITLLAWVSYCFIPHRVKFNACVQFLRTIGTTLPLAMFFKAIFKFTFGRICTRYWLLHPAADRLHWFKGQGNFAGFPSGHMAVFTVLLLALGAYDPGRRRAYAGLGGLIGLALIATNYHFLSDVIAGALLGLLIHEGVAWVLGPVTKHP